MQKIFLAGLYLFITLGAQGQNIQMPEVKDGESHFEWGAGLLSVKGAHYRGSNQSREWFIPLPYFTYTSEYIEAEPSFFRGTFYKNDWMALKLSLLVGLNVESESNRARTGMPNLDYTFEAGPMAIFKLYKGSEYSLTFEIPFRQVHTTDLTYIKRIGYFSVPYLSLKSVPQDFLFNWSYELSIAYMWGSREYHNFFYAVNPRFATTQRPAYQATAGYSGTQLTLILNKRWKDFIFVPFYRYDFLSNVAFEQSPLLKQKSYQVAGLAMFWLFGEDLLN